MKQLRVDVAPVPASKGASEAQYCAVARMVREVLKRDGVRDYRPATVSGNGYNAVVLDGVTVVYQYDISRDEFKRCGIVEVDA